MKHGFRFPRFRDWLWLAALALSVDSIFAATNLPPRYLALGPMLGEVSPGEARIWAKASGRAVLTAKLSENDNLENVVAEAETSLLPAADYMGHVRLTGLKPATRYFYRLDLNGVPAMLPPYPSFTTAPEPGTRGRQRICFVSCVGRTAADPAAAWADMAERAPFDLLLMLGDNHYADTTGAGGQRECYAEQRRLAGFRDVTRRVPVLAIWDDHDYGPNNSDGTASGKQLSLRTFKEHWANPAYGQEDDPGVYFKFTRGDVDFFMLDVRYNRSPNHSADDPPGTKTMLGKKQLAWFKRELAASRATVKLVASGSEWQPAGHIDSWTSFARERDEIFAWIETNALQGVILLSGDRHFTGGYHIRGKLIEFTSGPLGAKNYATKNLPGMFYNEGAGKLYSVLEIDTGAAEPQVTLEVYRAGEGLIHRQPFSWAQVNGREPIPLLNR